MTIYIDYKSKTVAVSEGKFFEFSNGKFGAELTSLPNEPFKKIIGKKGL